MALNTLHGDTIPTGKEVPYSTPSMKVKQDQTKMALNTLQDTSIPTVTLVETNDKPLGYELVNAYRTNKNASSYDLVELAQHIQTANQFTKANVGNKLQVIAEQVRFLQEQARKILEEANESNDLHHVACNFVKKPGAIYHLYVRESKQKFFSMISPAEWGTQCPHEYLGTYRLEYDQSWTPLEKFAQKDEDMAFINKILHNQTNLSITMGDNN